MNNQPFITLVNKSLAAGQVGTTEYRVTKEWTDPTDGRRVIDRKIAGPFTTEEAADEARVSLMTQGISNCKNLQLEKDARVTMLWPFFMDPGTTQQRRVCRFYLLVRLILNPTNPTHPTLLRSNQKI